MTTTEDALKKLRRPFTKNQMEERSEVWCILCQDGDRSCLHPIGTCMECGENMTAAHNHITSVPIESLRNRFLEIDPEWSWEPMGTSQAGLPAIVTQGRFEVLWIKLTILGITHVGVGQALASSDRKFGPAGLKSLAIANAALEFGVGQQARSAQKGQRTNMIQVVDAFTVTTPNQPDLPEGGAPARSTHEAVEASAGLDLKDVRAWLKAHHADLKITVKGSLVGGNLLRIEKETGVGPLVIREAILNNRPLDLPEPKCEHTSGTPVDPHNEEGVDAGLMNCDGCGGYMTVLGELDMDYEQHQEDLEGAG